MSVYVSITKFQGDWSNRSRGRKVKCPGCGHSFQAFVRLTDAWCGCGRTMKVLTERPPSSRVRLSGRENSPHKPCDSPLKGEGARDPRGACGPPHRKAPADGPGLNDSLHRQPELEGTDYGES